MSDARPRRRWLTFAEITAVVGLLIAGATLWLGWSQRRADEADRAQQAAETSRDRSRYDLRGTVRDDAVTLTRDEAHELHDVRVTFPTALAIAPQDVVTHRIERGTFAKAVLKAAGDRHIGRLPVLIAYSYASGDAELHRTAIYDIVWRVGGGFPFGHSLDLTDFRLHEHGSGVRRLDAVWAAETRGG